MRLTCPQCSKSLEYSGEPPNFCSFCGRALREVSASSLAAAEVPTVPPLPKPSHPESRVDLLADASTWVPAVLEVAGEPTRTLPTAAGVGGADPAAVGNYRLLRRLGGGGMGTVYEAEDLRSGQRVALKLISRDFAGHPEALKRFRQEGRLASQLSHPRCVFVLAVSEEQGRPYIVMELMTGQTLAEVVARRGPLPVTEAVAMIVDVIDGLMEAHRLGLVHRDVKPSNCFVEASGRVKIGDFGLSKSLLPQARGEAALTKTGAFLGTPLYAAPEQIKGEQVDHQVDVYAVSATLYFLLTGRAPFEGNADPLAVMARIVADPPPPLRQFRKELPAELEEVVMRGLERDRRKRWGTMAELRRALIPFLPRRRAYVGLGLRLGAYLIDSMLLSVLGALLVAPLQWLGELSWLIVPRYGTLAFELLFYFLGSVIHVVYFTILERRWGASVGKWAVRLRVQQLSKALPPTWGQALCRSAVFVSCFAVVEVPLLFLLPDVDAATYQSPQQLETEQRLRDFSRSGIWLVAVASGAILISVTMRRRNNLRGVHEFASGTQVVRLPGNWFARPTPLPVKSTQWEVIHPPGMPATIDRFHILGALLWQEDQQLLTASDPTLERTVWIWRRRVESGELKAARRSLSRTARWRWLAGGVAEEGWCWDAFLSRPGVPVTQLVRQLGRRPWREVRPILRQLADELAAACEDDTVPVRLGIDQVWLDEEGQVYLLDMPLRSEQEGDSLAPQARAVTLLCQTAKFLLEGRLPAEKKHSLERPWVPLPIADEKRLAELFAACLSANSFSLPSWAESFREADEAPLQVSRAWRVLLELGTGVVVLWQVALLQSLIYPLLKMLRPEPKLGVNELEKANAVIILSCLVVNVILSFLTRGGLRLGLFRVTLRTTRGQSPSRWRTAWRTLLAGSPFLVCELVRVGMTGVIGPSELDRVIVVAWLAVLASYVVLPLLWPHRTWYDYLSGIVVVPR